MAEKLKDMRDLLVHELNDLFSAEQQIVEALPKLSKTANSPKLKQAFDDHLTVTRAQVERLKQCFDTLGEQPGDGVCQAMRGLIQEGSKLLASQQFSDPAVLDAALISAAQRVEHYEIAGYGCARTFAQHLGEDKCVELLQQTLDEEGETDKKLTKLAESEINVKADQAGMEAGA